MPIYIREHCCVEFVEIERDNLSDEKKMGEREQTTDWRGRGEGIGRTRASHRPVQPHCDTPSRGKSPCFPITRGSSSTVARPGFSGHRHTLFIVCPQSWHSGYAWWTGILVRASSSPVLNEKCGFSVVSHILTVINHSGASFPSWDFHSRCLQPRTTSCL